MSKPEAITKAYKKPANLPKYGSLATIISEIKKGEDVLDVGCSEGYLASYLPNNKVWGIDANIEAIAKAKHHCVQVKLADLNNLPKKTYFEHKFNVIVFADVLEHLLYPDQVLIHFKSYLKPSGRVIVSLPNIALWRARANLLFGRFNYTEYGVMDRTHLHLYTFKTAQELLAKSGYKVRRQSGAANLFGWLVHTMPFLKGLLSIHIISVTSHKE